MEGLTMAERKKITKIMAQRYQKANKKEKGRILDEIVALVGYNRCYASWVLRNYGRKVLVYDNGKRTIFIGERNLPKKRSKRKIYDENVLVALKKIWAILDFPCSKRLVDYMKDIIAVLERHNEIKLDKETREKLNKISARTIDRLLKHEREKWQIKGKKRTKPGSLLKSQIPIRTFSEWDEKRPGFIEMDLVSHDGGDGKGIYAQTLDATDILTGWTETICVENKSQIKVFEGLNKIMKQFPFPILGIDSDNGSEFINSHLTRYCQENRITFTRTRPYRKNDNCYVEQKNWHIVRKTVGYWRYETEKEVEIINKIYKILRLYTNFFQVQMKLIEKKRLGSKVIKRYDKAKTPYKRIMECPEINEEIKRKLTEQYKSLNPVELKREIVKLQELLYKIVRTNPFYRKRIEEKKEKNKWALV